MNFKAHFSIALAAFSVLTIENAAISACKPPQNTSVIAESSRGIELSNKQIRSQAVLKRLKPFQTTTAKSYTLLLEKIKLDQLPEGVYEVYMSNDPAEVTRTVPENTAFVNTLDLYNLQSSSDKTMPVNVTKNVKLWLENGKETADIYVVVLFKGNVLPDNTPIQNAGKITIGEIRLLENR